MPDMPIDATAIKEVVGCSSGKSVFTDTLKELFGAARHCSSARRLHAFGVNAAERSASLAKIRC